MPMTDAPACGKRKVRVEKGLSAGIIYLGLLREDGEEWRSSPAIPIEQEAVHSDRETTSVMEGQHHATGKP